MRNIICAAAIAAITASAFAAIAPAAADTIEVVSYSVIYTKTSSSFGPGATISNNLQTGTSHEFSLTVNGAASSAVNFFTAAPGSCNSYCISHYLVNATAYGTVTVAMNFKDITTGATGSFSGILGDYSAKYTGAALACANDAGSAGGGQTDCIDWQGSGGYEGFSITVPVVLGADVLKVTLYNQEDWNITPKISFQLTDPGTTPLPGALPLFVSGSGLLGLLGWRRQKRSAKAA